MSQQAPMTTAEAAVETLIAHGIDTVYAIPGVQNDLLFDALYGAKDRIRVVNPRHEQAAAYMAMGAAMATGRPQVCAAVPGPGFLNASSALLTSYSVGAPVLMLAGQIPQAEIDRGHGHLHELYDQKGIAAHFSRSVGRISAPQDSSRMVAEALRTAQSGRKGPAFLECALDVWGKRALVGDIVVPIPRAPVDPTALEAAAKLLASAKKPLIIVGGGALGASPEVTALAEMLEAPVGAYRRGQGVVGHSHRLNVPLPVARRFWGEADAVLAIGTRLHLQQTNWGVDENLKVVRIDIDPEEPDRLRKASVALVGDAKDYCAALLAELPKHNGARPSRQTELDTHRAFFAERIARLEPQLGFLKAIRAALPADSIFVDEVTQIGFASRVAYPVEKPYTYLSPGYQDNLGWGVGTALGAQAACPDRQVLLVTGDGGFMYQVGELATAVQHKLPLIIVVFDNAMYGNVKRIQQEKYNNRVIASDLVNPDFGKLATAFGMTTYRAEDAPQLERAIREAVQKREPTLIHVPCGTMPAPWDMILMPPIRGPLAAQQPSQGKAP